MTCESPEERYKRQLAELDCTCGATSDINCRSFSKKLDEIVKSSFYPDDGATMYDTTADEKKRKQAIIQAILDELPEKRNDTPPNSNPSWMRSAGYNQAIEELRKKFSTDS